MVKKKLVKNNYVLVTVGAEFIDSHVCENLL